MMRKIKRLPSSIVVMLLLIMGLGGCGESTFVESTTQPTTPVSASIAAPTTILAQNPIANTTVEAVAAAITAIPPVLTTKPIANPNATNTENPTTAINSPKVEQKGFVQGSFKKIVTIILENTNYETALANPYLANLIKSGSFLNNYYAITHPSYPNYLALTGGSTFGQTNDGQEDLDKTNLSDLFDAGGISWKVYAEGLPKSCFLGVQANSYVRKHVPFASYVDVQKNPDRFNKIVDAKQLKTDVADNKLPQYSLYIPDLNNDGHDTGVNYAANWLNSFLTPLQNNPNFAQDTLVVVTFDEDHGDDNNHIYTLLLGQPVIAGVKVNTRFDHYSLLRTVEYNFNLGNLGREYIKATDITGVWKSK